MCTEKCIVLASKTNIYGDALKSNRNEFAAEDDDDDKGDNNKPRDKERISQIGSQ